MKIRAVGTELWADRRTEITKTIDAYRNFANLPKTNSVSTDTTCGML